jgi:hypothetical protein
MTLRTNRTISLTRKETASAAVVYSCAAMRWSGSSEQGIACPTFSQHLPKPNSVDTGSQGPV